MVFVLSRTYHQQTIEIYKHALIYGYIFAYANPTLHVRQGLSFSDAKIKATATVTVY